MKRFENWQYNAKKAEERRLVIENKASIVINLLHELSFIDDNKISKNIEKAFDILNYIKELD